MEGAGPARLARREGFCCGGDGFADVRCGAWLEAKGEGCEEMCGLVAVKRVASVGVRGIPVVGVGESGCGRVWFECAIGLREVSDVDYAVM